MDLEYFYVHLAEHLSIRPYNVSIPDEVVQNMRQILQLSRLPRDTFENTQTDRRYGVPLSWISNAKREWETNFDWYIEP